MLITFCFARIVHENVNTEQVPFKLIFAITCSFRRGQYYVYNDLNDMTDVTVSLEICRHASVNVFFNRSGK